MTRRGDLDGQDGAFERGRCSLCPGEPFSSTGLHAMIVLLISSLILVLGFSLESSPSCAGQGKMVPELDEKSGRGPLGRIPEEDIEEGYDSDYVDSDVPDGGDENDMLGDLASFPAEVRVLIYRQYFFGEGRSCHVRRSTRDLRSHAKEDAEDNITPRPCTIAHSLASNINGIALLQTNKRM